MSTEFNPDNEKNIVDNLPKKVRSVYRRVSKRNFENITKIEECILFSDYYSAMLTTNRILSKNLPLDEKIYWMGKYAKTLWTAPHHKCITPKNKVAKNKVRSGE